MQKWEHMVIVQVWNEEKQNYGWNDDKTDERTVIERLNALGQEGWELASTHSLGIRGTYYNQVLKRPIS